MVLNLLCTKDLLFCRCKQDKRNMEKQMILTANAGSYRKMSEIYRTVVNKMDTPLRLLTAYYSSVLGHEIDRRRTLRLLEVQLAFFVFILPADYSLLLRAIAFIWFLVAVKKIK